MNHVNIIGEIVSEPIVSEKEIELFVATKSISLDDQGNTVRTVTRHKVIIPDSMRDFTGIGKILQVENIIGQSVAIEGSLVAYGGSSFSCVVMVNDFIML